jgi:hypothetical protein
LIALAKIALDLDSSACGVEQAQPHSDQLALPAGAHDLDREPAAGLPDDRGNRDAEGALHSPGRDLHLDRGLVEPACLFGVVETDLGRDGRVLGLVVLPGRDLGDSP